MRRVALLALVLDTAIAGALVFAAPLVDAADRPAPRYVEVSGTCLEMVDVDAHRTSARPVAEALCAAG